MLTTDRCCNLKGLTDDLWDLTSTVSQSWRALVGNVTSTWLKVNEQREIFVIHTTMSRFGHCVACDTYSLVKVFCRLVAPSSLLNFGEGWWWTSGAGSIWTNQSFSARKDVVFMATLPGRACAQSAGERKISEKSKSRFKKTGHLLRGASVSISPVWNDSQNVSPQCAIICLSIWHLLQFCRLFPPRLQREEEEAYASRHQKAQSQSTITPFSKFEERKTKEKSSKVHTVTKFFTPSTKTPPKKGSYCCAYSTARV